MAGGRTEGKKFGGPGVEPAGSSTRECYHASIMPQQAHILQLHLDTLLVYGISIYFNNLPIQSLPHSK